MVFIRTEIWLTALAVGFACISGCSHDRRLVCAASDCRQCAAAAVPSCCSTAAPAAAEPATVADEPAATEKEAKPEAIVSHPVTLPPVVGSVKETVRRRSYIDLTASPHFDHADDYTMLVGELRFDPASNAWKIRYASAEEGDLYGGSVIVEGIEPVKDRNEVRLVRVQGALSDPNTTLRHPLYRVTSMRVMELPPWAKP